MAAAGSPDARGFPPTALSPDAAPFAPLGRQAAEPGSEAGKQFARCSAKLRALRGDSSGLREELNLLFDQLISENYQHTVSPNTSIPSEEVCSLLRHVSSLVPQNQEHLVIKLCQLIHHLLNQLKVIVDEQTCDVLVSYVVRALYNCSQWTHTEVLLALSAVVYGNGPQCQKHLNKLLGEEGVLLLYSSPSQPDMELRRVALTCLANVCFGIPAQPPLEEKYRTECFRIFLRTLQSPKPPNCDELVYCMVVQGALKGLQCCLSCGKWRFGGGEELGSLLATIKRLMFLGAPGVCVEWPPVLYPAPLPQYEGLPTLKPSDPPKEAATPGKGSGNKKKKARGKGKKKGTEEKRTDDGEDEGEAVPSLRGDGANEEGQRDGGEGHWWAKPPALPFHPPRRVNSSDSEFSDPDGRAPSKVRLYQGRVRQGSLHCLLALVKGMEKRTLYGYWSSFIPGAPVGGPPPLTLLTIALKDPSPKVRANALQVLSAMLDSSRQFLGIAEDTASPRTSFTPFSLSLATTIRELHRTLSLALLAETSAHTLTQVIKCLAYLVASAPYQRLRPGLLSPLWKQLRPYIRHRDVNVRVSVLTLYGALVRTQAPLPEVLLLLQQPEGGGGGSGSGGSLTPQDGACSWRHREGVPSPSRTWSVHGRRNPSRAPCSPAAEEDEEQQDAEGSRPPWLLQLCVALVTQPREDQSDSEGVGVGGAQLEPAPVRLEALQVLAHLVRGYFSLAQACLCEMGQVSASCLRESDPSIQLHGAKLLEELGTGIIQQYRAENGPPEMSRVPMALVVQFWIDVLSGPLNGALQNEQHRTLQTSACDALSSILPQAFAQLPDKTQMMCITVLLGLTYSESSLVKAAAVRALGVYILFPCLREDVMFVADTANTILTALEDRSAIVRAKAAWSLGNLTDTLIVNMESVGVDFQDELSDMLLLRLLQSATRASADKDRVKCNAVRSLGNLLHFLHHGQLARSAFQRPMEDAVRALVQTVQSEATMKIRWNACYALGNAFRNPALPLDSAPWASDAFAALCSVVTSCKNFKVRIQSAAALSVPGRRGCYGDAACFASVWRSLAAALENSEDAADFVEYQYCASLRHALSKALLHLLSLGQARDMAALAASLAVGEGRGVRGYLTQFLGGEEEEAAATTTTTTDGEKEGEGSDSQHRVAGLQQTLSRLKELKVEEEEGEEVVTEQESCREVVVDFLQELIRNWMELKVVSAI